MKILTFLALIALSTTGKSKDEFAPLENDRKAVEDYLRQQQVITDDFFRKSKSYPKLLKSMDDRMAQISVMTLLADSEKYQYLKLRQAGKNTAEFFSLNKKTQTLTAIPLPEAGKDISRSLEFIKTSKSGKYVAIGLSENGSNVKKIFIYDADAGIVRQDPIGASIFHNVSFSDDEKSVVYVNHDRLSTLTDQEDFKSTRAYIRSMESQSSPEAVYGFGVESSPRAEEDDYPVVMFPESSDYAVAFTNKGTSSGYRIEIKKSSDLRNKSICWEEIVSTKANANNLSSQGNRLFYSVPDSQGQLRLQFIDLSQKLKEPKTIYSESEGYAIIDFVAAKDALYLFGRKNLETFVLKITYENFQRSIASLGVGTTLDDYSPAHDSGFLAYLENPRQPSSYQHFHPASMKFESLGQFERKAPVDIETEVYMVNADDGVKIPLIVVHKAGNKINAPRPALLRVYGAYGEVTSLRYNSYAVEWLNNGGIEAQCLVRGGGDLGERWHTQATRKNKKRSIDDAVACIEFMEKRGITSPKKLAIFGASAGGIISSYIAVKRPELIQAAVIDVGVSNLLRFQTTPFGLANISEFGDVDIPEELAAIRRIDAYSQVGRKKYPAVYITAGLNDSAVPAWMSAKMHIKLKKNQTGPNPILIGTDFETGHQSGGSTRSKRVEYFSKLYAFLLDILH